MSFTFGLATLLVVRHELRLRRELQKVELSEARQLRQEELSLRKQQLNIDSEQQQVYRKWLDQEIERIASISERLAEGVSTRLREDPMWASVALERAKLYPLRQTIFADRLGHFSDEKEYLARQFVPLLLSRCKHFALQGPTYLVLDSGTTIYALFEQLGEQTVKCAANKESWLSNLRIVTNNLPGVSCLVDSGRLNPGSRYSPLAVECQLLPGAPAPVYSAITGELTNDALNYLREKGNGNATFIGVVTGNWIQLSRDPVCPIPLARGTGHREFKEEVTDNCDELYVVAPLGKVFFDVAVDEINESLGFTIGSADPDREAYQRVGIKPDKAREINLVSTTRNPNRLLSNLSIKVEALLGTSRSTSGPPSLESPHHLLFPYNDLPSEWHEEFEIEFPHRYTHREEIWRKLFFVSPPE